MKPRNHYRLFLETLNTVIFAAGVGYVCWWLHQLLPMLICFD